MFAELLQSLVFTAIITFKLINICIRIKHNRGRKGRETKRSLIVKYKKKTSMEFVTAIATSIVGKIAEYTVAPVGRQFGYLFCYTSNIDGLRTRIQDLEDAKLILEHRTGEATRNGEKIEAVVQRWLDRVVQISKEAEILLKNEGHAKASCSCGSFPHLVTRHQLSRKAKKMTLEVRAVSDAGKFDKISYLPPIKSSYEISKGYETFVTRTAILEDIMEALRDVSKSRIGIYGMGGIGKTMLAKEIARQVEKEKLFSEVVMTTISQNPNIKDIQQDIAEKLGIKNFNQTESMDRRADLLRNRLKQENKILLILDDIWGELDLLAIGIHFEDDKQGCKMLLTSRSLNVLCNFMGAEENFSIEALDVSEATSLFNKIVGDIVEKAEFKSLAFDIIRECAGLPISITTVAHALKNKNNLSIWKDASQQLKSSDSTVNRRMYKKVYSSIKLSYNFLGNDEEVKSLLLLCCLHKEDQNIRVEDLMRYSVGWNLLRGVNTMEDARNKVSSLVDELKSHCLLLDGSSNFYGPSVKVHDVIRDVCISIAMEDKQMYNITSIGKLEEFLNKKKHKESKAISLLEYDDFGKLPKRLESPQLELLLLSDSYSLTSVPDDFFEQTRELEALGLNDTGLKLLPSSFHLLQNLQTLCLRYSKLEDVALIGDLKNLKVLDLSSSTVKRLPKRIGELCRLQLLDLQECQSLKVIEQNVISKLTRLEELYLPQSYDGWEVEEDGIDERRKASLTELKNLQQLTVLYLRVSDAKVLPEDLFSEKLERYRISIGSQHYFYPGAGFSRSLHLGLHQRSQLNALGLESLMKRSDYLSLDGLMGVNNVVHDLDREGFPQLKHLQFWNNDGVQYIINSMDQLIHSSRVFPSLETLWLNRLTNLETICHGELPANSFDKLREVNVRNCGNLKNLFPLSIVKRLERITVVACEMMEEIVAHGREDHESDEVEFPELRYLNLESLPSKILQFCWSNEVEANHGSSLIDLPKPLFSAKVSFPNLEKLTLCGMNVEKLWPDQFLANSNIRNLTSLQVTSCNSIKYLFSFAMVERLVNLKTLKVADCVAIEEILVIKKLRDQAISLEQTPLPKLESLEFFRLPALKRFCSGATQTFFNEKVSFPNLEELTLSGMTVEKLWPDQPLASSYTQNLTSLRVRSCNSIKNLFSFGMVERLVNLKKLEVADCVAVEEILVIKKLGDEAISLEQTPFSKLESLKLSELPAFKRFFSEATQTLFNEKVSFPNLEELTLSGLNVEKLWPDQLLASSYTQNLTSLSVRSCNSIKNLFSFGMVLVNLKTLEVADCVAIEEILVIKKLGDEAISLEQTPFPKLESLELSELLALKRFFSGATQTLFNEKVIFPNLKELRIDHWSEATNEILDMSQSSIIPVFRNLEVLDVRCRSHDKPISLSIFEFLHRQPNIQRLTLRGFFADGILWQHHQQQHGDGPQENDGTYKLNNRPLKELTLLDVHILRHLFGDPENAQQSNALSFQTSESLFVGRCSRLQSFALSFMSFHNLTSLTVRECHGLKYLFPSSTATSLVHLKEMSITNCKGMREIINGDYYKEGKIIERCQQNEFVFKSLEILVLRDLPNLTSFYRGSNVIRFPSLKKLFVSQCPEMRSFSHGIISTFPLLLNTIIAEIEYQWMWENINYLREIAKAIQPLWDGDVNTTVRKLWEDSSNFELGLLFAHETDVQNCEENAA